MESVIAFLVANYVWFLVGVVVLVFALIGYLVDVKNKKKIASGEMVVPVKAKKEKSKEELTKESVSEMENVALGDAMKPKNKKKEEVKEEPKEDQKENPKEEAKKESEATYDEPIIKEADASEDSFEVDEK